MSWICSGVSDATSAASAAADTFGGSSPCPGCCACGIAPADTGVVGAGGIDLGSFSLPLLSTHIPTNTVCSLCFGNLRLSRSSMNSGTGSDGNKGTMYSSRPGWWSLGRGPQGNIRPWRLFEGEVSMKECMRRTADVPFIDQIIGQHVYTITLPIRGKRNGH